MCDHQPHSYVNRWSSNGMTPKIGNKSTAERLPKSSDQKFAEFGLRDSLTGRIADTTLTHKNRLNTDVGPAMFRARSLPTIHHPRPVGFPAGADVSVSATTKQGLDESFRYYGRAAPGSTRSNPNLKEAGLNTWQFRRWQLTNSAVYCIYP
uniref:Uncharacterized protein n=2 Tax=Oxyrrhis marina TaxID=2969 RepID=A0A7S3XGQ3_OXYMA